MLSNDRLVLRIPSDLKALFVTICEKENISVSAKIKELIAKEVQNTLDKSMYHQKQVQMFPNKPKIVSNSTKVDNNPLMQFSNENNSIQNPHTGDIEVNRLVSNAINSAKIRKKNKKKKR